MFRPKAVFGLSLAPVVFSVFAFAGVSCASEAVPPPPAPAAFQVAELAISPDEVTPREKVTITAKVTNTGGTEGSYTAELKINDVTEATSKVTVAAGASQLLSFVVSKDTPGTYRVTWGELTGEFVVVKPVPPEPASPEPIVRTLTVTDAKATRLLREPIPGASAHFVPENKVELRYSFVLKLTFRIGVSEGRLWLDGVPSWIPEYLSGVIGDYTSYSEGKLFLTALPPWVDPTEEIAPDVTELPTFESITTEEGKAIITYLWP